MQNQAQLPVYGQTQIAGYLNNLNQLTQGASNQLSQGLASRGALNSGALGAGLGNLQMNRLNNATNFTQQIPFLNQQAMNSNMAQANGLANNFKAPYGSTTSGTSNFQNQGTTNTVGTGFNNSQSQQGQTGGLLGALGSLLQGPLSDLLKNLGKSNPSASGGSGVSGVNYPGEDNGLNNLIDQYMKGINQGDGNEPNNPNPGGTPLGG